MKLQRIIAKDSRSATEQAIAQYGRDVLVVSNSRVNGMTELIVAVDVQPDQMPPPALRPGAGQVFDSALQSQFTPPPAGGAASQVSGAGSVNLPPSSGATSAANGSAGFVPAQLALMKSAQRAAAAIESANGAAAAPHALGAPLSRPDEASAHHPASTRAAVGLSTIRYGQHLTLPSLPSMGLGTISLNLPPRGSTTPPAMSADQPTRSVIGHGPGSAAPAAMGAIPSNADAPIPTAADARAAVELIRQEIAQLRKEMRMGQQLQAWAAQGPSHRWNEAMTEVGVPTALRALLISGLSNDYDDAQALEAIRAQVRENLPGAPSRTQGRQPPAGAWTRGAHLLSGPSGAGKTAMAARLAQEAAERLGVDGVILVSWNDARPGAWGQLQLWAARIGVPAFRAADSATLELLLQEHRGHLVIIDSGLSQPDILAAATQGVPVIHHLVMPADATAATLRRWIGEQVPAWQDLMVTRLDESAQPWPLLQACCEHQLRPAAASDGSGIHHLRHPYDAGSLLQHGMGLLAAQLAAQSGQHAHEGGDIEIPTIAEITTSIPSRQAGRSGRAQTGRAGGRGAATSRHGASND